MSSRSPESEPESTVVDTVVLRYFLLVDRVDILFGVLGSPLVLSRIVFDPDDPRADELSMSEIVRSIHVQTRRASDPTRTREDREQARKNGERLSTVSELVAEGQMAVVDMTEEERRLFMGLTSVRETGEFGIRLPLGYGEAATLAVALGRDLVFATDDNDALRALDSIAPGHPRKRIRAILIEAADAGIITRAEANALHEEMRDLGFWDRESPFPDL